VVCARVEAPCAIGTSHGEAEKGGGSVGRQPGFVSCRRPEIGDHDVIELFPGTLERVAAVGNERSMRPLVGRGRCSRAAIPARAGNLGRRWMTTTRSATSASDSASSTAGNRRRQRLTTRLAAEISAPAQQVEWKALLPSNARTRGRAGRFGPRTRRKIGGDKKDADDEDKDGCPREVVGRKKKRKTSRGAIRKQGWTAEI